MNPRLDVPLLILALATAACGKDETRALEKPRGLPVRTASVEARDIESTVRLTGSLKPRAQVEVVAEVGARLLRIVKDEGARVEMGDVLAVLDDTDYRLSHDRAAAALKVAEANRAHAQVEKERADNLLKTGGVTDKDHLAAQVNLQVAEASLGQVKAEAAIAAQQLSRCQVRSPLSGRVARRHVDAGAQLASGTPIFTVVDDGRLEFRSQVPSADYARVKVGDPVEVKVEALGKSFPGRVARVTPLVDERSRSFEAVVEVPGGRDLVGGLFARADVRVGKVAGALVVPPTALVRDGADPAAAQAFVVAGGKAERRSLKLGVETAHAVQVTEGLKAGDVVVLDPPVALSDGTQVEAQAGR
jgi:RND family efflux transporter MFP subunit